MKTIGDVLFTITFFSFQLFVCPWPTYKKFSFPRNIISVFRESRMMVERKHKHADI